MRRLASWLSIVALPGCVFELADVVTTPPPATRWRARIDVDASLAATPLLEVPLLVSLDATRIDYATTLPDGADLSFALDDGTELAHEIERWSPGGVSAVWVKLPMLEPNVDTFFWMQWGESGHSADATQVWSAYTSAWHLSDDLADGMVRDSASSGAVGTIERMSTDNAVDGHTGGGFFFNGITGEGPRVSFPDDPRFDVPPDGARSIELWLRREPGSSQDGLLAEKEGCCLGWTLQMGGGLVHFRIGTGCCVMNCCGGDVDDYQFPEAQPLPGGAGDVDWHYAVQTMDRVAGEIRGYLDARGSMPAVIPPNSTVGNSQLRLGGSFDELNTVSFHGVLDELRIAPIALSADWVAVQHASMTDVLLSYNAPEAF